MSILVITYLPKVSLYLDRIKQLYNTSVERVDLHFIVITKELSDKGLGLVTNNFEFLLIPNNILFKSVFLDFFVLQYCLKKKKKIYLIDWFSSFFFSALVLKFKSDKNVYIFSPVTSNWGYVIKQFSGQFPFFDLRYLWNKLKGVPTELLSIFICNYLVLQSEELSVFYQKYYPVTKNKLKVNYNYFQFNHNQKSRKLAFKNSEMVIGFIGNIERHKGNKELLKLINTFQNLKFILAGGAKGRRNIKILENIMTYSNVEYLGRINLTELGLFYERIDVLILPSFHEGSPRVVGEFIEFNKPIISYYNPGLDYCKNLNGVYFVDYREKLGFERVIKEELLDKSIEVNHKLSIENSKYELFNEI